jgi:hypothetical protein
MCPPSVRDQLKDTHFEKRVKSGEQGKKQVKASAHHFRIQIVLDAACRSNPYQH